MSAELSTASALNTGSTEQDLRGVLDALEGVVDPEHLQRARLLLARVVGK